MSFIDKFLKAINLAIKNPKLLQYHLQGIGEKSGNATPKKYVSHTVDWAKNEILKKAYQKVLVLSDKFFYDELGQKEWTRTSTIYGDCEKDYFLESLNLSIYDAIIVGGKDVKTNYIYMLKVLKRNNLSIPVIWVGEGFEYSGSTFPLISDIDDAHIFLFNHYEDLFLIKDPLQITVLVKDSYNLFEETYLVGPGETVKLSINDLMPDREDDCVIEVSTTHPVLTRGRHLRWRLWADVYSGESIASSHGAHDFGASHLNTAYFSKNIINKGSIIFTLPNYEKNLIGIESEAVVIDNGLEVEKKRSNEKILDRVNFSVTNSEGYAGIEYFGSGDSFIYSMGVSSKTKAKIVMLNHGAGQLPRPIAPKKLKDSSRVLLKGMREGGFFVHPHAIPVFSEKSDLEFGFSFDGCNPPVKNFIAHCFFKDGKNCESFEYFKDGIGYRFIDDITEGKCSAKNLNLVVLEPNFLKENIDPIGFSMVGDLAIRNRISHDMDYTEFQSCWRNVGHQFKDFPHWLHSSKLVNGTANLVGRVLAGDGKRTGLALVNASGNMNYRTKASCNIKIFNSRGVSICQTVELKPFEALTAWFDELFINLDDFLVDGFGGCIISSADADLNAQIYTENKHNNISLQHLWGY